MNHTPEQIKALISLLDDPDKEVSQLVRNELIALGTDAIPDLENAWEQTFGTINQGLIEELIHSIQLDGLRSDLKTWIRGTQPSIFKGALLVARYQYPDFHEEPLYRFLEQLKQDIWLELNEQLTAMEVVNVFNHILFEVHGFSGNTTSFHAPQNSYMNLVMESKKGNPLSLCILYAELAKLLNIPIYGVNLPQHFILAYCDRKSYWPYPAPEEELPVLFYINPFSRGSIFSHRDIDAYLKQINVAPQISFFQPCQPGDAIIRMLHNLVHAYTKLGYPDKISDLKTFITLLEKNKG